MIRSGKKLREKIRRVIGRAKEVFFPCLSTAAPLISPFLPTAMEMIRDYYDREELRALWRDYGGEA